MYMYEKKGVVMCMNAANELHEKNPQESKALENMARSLYFEAINYICFKLYNINNHKVRFCLDLYLLYCI